MLDEHPVLADHLPRPEVRDGGVVVRIEDAELAAGHDVCIARLLALLEQELAVGERARLHERRQETQVFAGEHAEHLAGTQQFDALRPLIGIEVTDEEIEEPLRAPHAEPPPPALRDGLRRQHAPYAGDACRLA